MKIPFLTYLGRISAVILMLSARVSTAEKLSPNSRGLTGKNTCEFLVNASIASELEKATINLTQAQRLYGFMSALSPEQQRQLLKAATSDNLPDFTRRMRADKLTAQEKEMLAKLPGADLIIQDLADVNETIPNVLALESAVPIVMKSLEVIHRQELAVKTDHVDLIKSQGQAARFKRTLENTLINFIVHADGLYNHYNAGRIKMFFFPLLKPVRKVLDWGRNVIRELTRMRMVDNLAVKLFLSETLSNGATDEEIKSAMTVILDSPEALKDLRNNARAVLGKDFDIGNEINIFADVYRSAKLATAKDERFVNEKFDTANIAALQRLNELLNATRQRKGLGKRQAKDFDIDELHLYFEAFQRRLSLYADIYLQKTAQGTGDTYSVERRYYVPVTVPDGVDDKGNPKTKTVMEERFRWESVDPSFENVLSRSFDDGDRFVTGLDGVKARSANLAQTERKYRDGIAKAESLIEQMLEGYNEAITSNVKKYEDSITAITKKTAELENLEQEQKAYLQWVETPNKITKQYEYDTTEAFQARNEWMLNRIRNAKQLMQNLQELMRRRSLTLTPTYDIMPLEQWLYNLKHKRNINYTIKGGILTIMLSAGGSYAGVPEIQMAVDEYFRNLMQSLRGLGY